jgi:hypothetical protein
MAYQVRILKRADLELEEIFLYYQNLSVGLGEKFLNEYENQLKTLNTIPFFEVKYTNIRKLPIKKFPYTIHFRVDEKEKKVFIEAITCDYQDPNSTKVKI